MYKYSPLSTLISPLEPVSDELVGIEVPTIKAAPENSVQLEFVGLGGIPSSAPI